MRFRRRAVVIGITYRTCGEIALKGCANDAFAFATSLVNLWHFDPAEILLLTDDASAYEKDLPEVELSQPEMLARIRNQMPYRINILLGLKWLTSNARPGDTLVFYFAGHGLQMDNLSGWEGEGFDEAILPLDCTHQSGDVNAISAVALRSHFLSMGERVQLSIFLDCAGGQSALDVTGGRWQFIRGVVQKGVWPLTDPTDKMHRAQYDSKVWTHTSMRDKDCRPRYVPGIEVNNTNDLGDVHSRVRKGVGEKTHAFMIAGAPFSEVPIEGLCPALRLRAIDKQAKMSKDAITTAEAEVYHGAFTWSLIKAFQDLSRYTTLPEPNALQRVTFSMIYERVIVNIRLLAKQHGLRYLNQQPAVTCYLAFGSDPNIDCAFYPFGGRLPTVKYYHGTSYEMRSRKPLVASQTVHNKQMNALTPTLIGLNEVRVIKNRAISFMNVSQLNTALESAFDSCSKSSTRKRTQALEDEWRAPASRSTVDM